MKKRNLFLPALPALICLILCACGAQNEAGDDWRDSGAVVGSGIITHDGSSAGVLVTVSESSAAFYWDNPAQVLFDSVSFPMTIPDAEQAFRGISFSDINGDGESDVQVNFLHEDGSATELIWIWDPVERYVFREDLSAVSSGEGKLDGYVGLWAYQNEALWLRIHDDGVWEFLNEQESVLDHGTLWADSDGVTLHFDNSGDVLYFSRTVSGDLIDTVNNSLLVPVEAILVPEPYFAQNNLTINAEMEMGTYLLNRGVCFYSGIGDGYATDDCYWELTTSYDATHDGIHEIQFDAVCYVPESSVPDFQTAYVTNTDSELYDFYSGMWLTAASSYGNSSRGENYYRHTVSWQGNSYMIEFAYSTDWRYNVEDWAIVLTKSYVVYMPEEYDGLVFAAESQPDTYQESARRMQLDFISPEKSILDLATVDPYSNLYFRICE